MTQQRRDMMADYVPVAERVQAFYDRFPEGSIQSEITHLDERLVVVKAWAYRTADDPRPGVGHSSMLIPGSTNFTRGSEVENTESSAWGRAIAALGFEVKRGIASREEVENKQNEHERPIRPPQARGPQNRTVEATEGTPEDFLGWAFNEHGLGVDAVLTMLGIDGERFNVLTPAQLERAGKTIMEKIGVPS